ncbi:phosphoribosylformylglycinamidine synthase subunit PurL [Allobranchiibius sp. GilTou38]|uniref:phosphoribosylformylglycinamidine synthase subunit PurL n=1 Tax=Allobranchiibius sp. GilTou38 TaxID=2815210 RepID=UPI001AA1690B|nr:phosphoribosylformylglycinamidine synthase subunit PurL [Allobranchiibius sp. GilTou38]MBO1767095.1 phosphoribosylformylglycinamidine synthase subunit PurL [Allobranchiibius sp. GilTou38]
MTDNIIQAPSTEGVDTVGRAADSPDVVQPWAQLGLKEEEYARIREILGRRPTSAELAMYSVMWSEHCSYKSSKVHLRRFGDLPAETPIGKQLAGIGENAGVVDIGQGWAVTFKIESHNHPSYIEPHQGAATGVGGIVRDIMAMGARPIAVMDPLRFGAIDHPDTLRVLPGVVAGIGGYGNCLGLPNIGGEVVFDECYQGNPLVNALCVGALRHEDLHLAKATGVGNKVVLFGAKTGGDGIGGVSVLASETFDSAGPTKRPSVQVGDPFAEKVLIECCLDLYRAGVVEGIQDLGGAGLSCATSELASAGDGGMTIELDTVPLRDASLRPEEILMSESQERMMAVVAPDQLAEFLAITDRWDVEATVLGEVTDGTNLIISWHGETIVDVPPRSVAHDGPVYERPMQRPAYLDALQADSAVGLARPSTPAQLREQLLQVLASPNICDKSWITDQYDRYVRGNTSLAMPDDAGVVRVDESTGLGVALSTDCNARFAQLDPYAGAQLALAEAYRNVATTGALPVAVSDCLNFGSPEDAGVMWQFSQAVDGIVDGCRAFGVPVTGGNVSFYNQTGATAIHPTPVLSVLGVLEDVARRTPSGWSTGGLYLFQLGATREEFDGSEWAGVVHDHLGGTPPRVDLAAERALADVLVQGARDGVLAAAHDLSQGGLAVALMEGVLRHGIGARISLSDSVFTDLFSESAARAVVAVAPEHADALASLCVEHGVEMSAIGVTAAELDGLQIEGVDSMTLEELRRAHTDTLPAVFG